jgi:hypothetical protein
MSKVILILISRSPSRAIMYVRTTANHW